MTTALLLSGGMDSVSIAWWLRPDVALTIDYGQKPAEAEIDAAGHVAQLLGISHEVIRVDCSSLGSGDMAGTAPDAAAPVSEWWPFRNQLLVTLAGMAAVRHGVSRLLIGALATDGAHADGRPEFVERASQLMAMQEGGIVVEAPAIELDAVELVRRSGIDQGTLAWAHSCHTGNYACGRCRGCTKHFNTWQALGWTPH
ncbi:MULTISPECIES: 7-cyano-7-deazaguanine synthase [Mesorhizobium]|uniref:7-cyano-7-deazaguanine synthase n=1 Tax=Mesorhizobium japonicum (strain LMG 29417 / CECT 9101 / MAFF 303099) TaxID=266835 RepID=Q989H2_RHILO|nr:MULTISPECIES: 7-cyano-7-deazaguanine synthase [Mesorhizobium]QKC98703.1 7-cyano-7-deazaguanine synthase [Mesorhizobium sp. NZP2298]BAB52724.1 mll6423 [Mesorhizobium japonicum MAFF 303099]